MPRLPLATTAIGTLCLLSIVAGARASASEGPPPVLNPKTYASPSGEFEVMIDPSTMHGQGAGTYRVTRRGKEAWSATHPFTTEHLCSEFLDYLLGVIFQRPQYVQPSDLERYAAFIESFRAFRHPAVSGFGRRSSDCVADQPLA